MPTICLSIIANKFEHFWGVEGWQMSLYRKVQPEQVRTCLECHDHGLVQGAGALKGEIPVD